VPAADAARVSQLPPTAVMFAALLGYNPIQMLLGPVLTKLPASHAAYLTGHSFFPSLISAPFQAGLNVAFDFAIAACLIAAVASLLRGKRYVHEVHGAPAVAARPAALPAAAAARPAAAAASAVAARPAALRVAAPEAVEGHAERARLTLDPAIRS
jgi:hypothetical protein